jgi:DedD protein
MACRASVLSTPPDRRIPNLMGMFDFLKRGRSPQTATPPKRSSVSEPDDVRRVRTRTRRRLMGVIVLVTVGVIAFPIVFESQPRPIPVDIPIEIPRVDGAAPLAIPPARSSGDSEKAPSSTRVTTADSARQGASGTLTPVAAPAEPPPEPASTPAVAPRATPSAPPPRATAASFATPASSVRATSAKPPSAAVAAPPVATAVSDAAASSAASSPNADVPTKFIVQVGAFTESSAAREVQTKLDKLGLKTYTQVADTTAGRRIRVRLGPFTTRDDADKAAARAREAGVATVVLKL